MVEDIVKILLALFLGTILPGLWRKLASREDEERRHLLKATESHRDQLSEHLRKIENLHTRLEFREGVYGPDPLNKSSPGTPPSPELKKLQDEYKSGKKVL